MSDAIQDLPTEIAGQYCMFSLSGIKHVFLVFKYFGQEQMRNHICNDILSNAVFLNPVSVMHLNKFHC